MCIRREVLGDQHVDRSTANATDLDRPFLEWITANHAFQVARSARQR